MKSKILILEDDININNLIKMHLTKEGYKIIQSFDGKEAMELFDTEIDLAILDIMVPFHDGFEVLEYIRRKSQIPVIFLTARDEDSDKVLALGLGADDYVTKPFSVIEIISRCNAHLRRYLEYSGKLSQTAPHTNNILQNGNIIVDIDNFKISKANSEIMLNVKEFKLLVCFMKNTGRIFTKKQLYEQVWEENYFGDDNTIMVHISRLREKLEDNPKKPEYIKTIKGLGYRMLAK